MFHCYVICFCTSSQDKHFFFHSFNFIVCIIQGWTSIMIHFILRADILLHWIRIILCWIGAQHLGYSGLICFHLLLFLRIIFNALWNLPVQWLGVCSFLFRSYVIKWDSQKLWHPNKNFRDPYHAFPYLIFVFPFLIFSCLFRFQLHSWDVKVLLKIDVILMLIHAASIYVFPWKWKSCWVEASSS